MGGHFVTKRLQFPSRLNSRTFSHAASIVLRSASRTRPVDVDEHQRAVARHRAARLLVARPPRSQSQSDGCAEIRMRKGG